MQSAKILNANIVNEGQIFSSDLLIKDGLIERIDPDLKNIPTDLTIEAEGKYLFPGVIDDQVHFREPGLTHKATIYTEAKAAVAGGVTTFMEMPNTNPQTLTQELLTEKYALGAKSSLANYSFYMGVSNENIEEVLKTDPTSVCGLKIFMGSSTGNMLVDDEETLHNIFAKTNMLIATHCEDEATIRHNLKYYKENFGEQINAHFHPLIRSVEACYRSSSRAVALAKEHKARLHILHISTKDEISLFDNNTPLRDKKITAEACIHHLWFDDHDYEEKGNLIKWNPAVKSPADKKAIFNGVLDNHIDIIATDHAPHTLEEKQQPYLKAPSGGPLIQHSLPAMLEFYHQGKISLEKIAEKMAHNPAIMFQVAKRGFIREGYYADLTLFNLNKPWKVTRENILAKCGWSPFEGQEFRSTITHTFVSGHLAYADGKFDESKKGERVLFNVE